MIKEKVHIRWFQTPQNYLSTWRAMQAFTDTRQQDTIDEIWFLEHEPVFTQGQNGKEEHILATTDIPIVKTDRGGQVTYHGPGQLMVYTLIDLKRKQLTIRDMVTRLEDAVIDYLAAQDIKAIAKREAPGVYVNNEKICSIGLRVRRGATYHGIAFNINMDLNPFSYINPCGFSGLKMTQVSTFDKSKTVINVGHDLLAYLLEKFGYTTANQLSTDEN